MFLKWQLVESKRLNLTPPKFHLFSVGFVYWVRILIRNSFVTVYIHCSMTFKIYLNTLDVEQSFIKRENASKWRTYLVRALFICLLALCSFTVAWFFAGARYVPSIQISQKQVQFIIRLVF